MSDEPRALGRVSYVMAGTPEHRAARRRLLWTVGLAVLVLLTATHALADTAAHGTTTRTMPVRLDRPYDEEQVFTTTVQVFAPLGAKVWPRLAMSGAPVGQLPESATMPPLRVESYVDGELVGVDSIEGDASTLSGHIGMFACRPKSACPQPPVVVGWRTLDVAVVARVVNTPQAHAGTYGWDLGPIVVEIDRGPWAP